MKKRVVVVVLAVLMATSAYAQATDFVELVKTGTPQSIQAAIDQGANANARDMNAVTPLMYAAVHNPNPDVITTLLKAGAEINARANAGTTPLMWAALANPNPEVITTLLRAGADIKARENDNGMTSLMWAALANPNPEVITVLLKAGANAKTKDRQGLTALDYAKDNAELKGTDSYQQLQEASQ